MHTQKAPMAQLISIDDLTQKNRVNPKAFALFELAFRPFFLLGSAFALLAMIPWVLSLHGVMAKPQFSTWWHAHEMIFGFALAIILGFLLTAAQTWTGVASVRGAWLAGLVGLWLTPRIGLALWPDVPIMLWAILDLSCLMGAWAILARMIFKVKQWRNAPFLALLLLFALLNGASYYSQATAQLALATRIHYASVGVIAVVLNLMGGRVIPAFTQNATKFGRQPESPWLLRLSNLGLLLMALSWLMDWTVGFRVVAGFTALVLFYRFHGWGWFATRRNPLLWSLHLSFVCLPMACALWALGYPSSGALHVLTVGAIAGLILAMISRVSLGHTARLLQAPRALPSAYALMFVAALLRGLAAWTTLWPQAYLPLIDAAVLCWLVALLIFLWQYSLILLRPRLDGKRG